MASPVGGGDDDDGHLFAGVRFVLVGFDHVSESQYRSEMVRRLGVDAGRLGDECTHVIVCGRLYDDPACVAARAEGKKVVTELWVDDSLERGVLADTDKVIYWPLRDLKGIPGSESLNICLTGYQRNDREDIMNMVSLMGAQFSKPLMAHAVTHLICYKFEGEKYELAKRVNIKLVNHRWLEDCLKSWEILPVDDYNKSSWELEIMEAQAKDSEEEDVGRRAFNNKIIRRTPNTKGSARTAANTVVNAPIRSPTILSGNMEIVVKKYLNTPDQIRKSEDADTHDNEAQGTPKTTRSAMSANADFSAPTQIPFILNGNRAREDAAVRDLNTSSQIQGSKYKDVGTRTLDVTSGASGTPSSSKLVIPDCRNFNSLNETKFAENHGCIDVGKAYLVTPSRGNQSVNVLDSCNVARGQSQEDYGATFTLNAATGQSNVYGKIINGDDQIKSGSSASSINKRYSKSIEKSERFSDNCMPSPQGAEGSMFRGDSNISSACKGDKRIFEIAGIQVLKGENIQNENVVEGAHAQKKKCLISPASSKLQNGYMGSETGTLNSPFLSKFSNTSEPAIQSSKGTNSREATNVELGKQQSGSSKSRSRKTSLKHGIPFDGVKLSEYSASKTDAQPLLKPKEMVTTSPSATVQDGKRCLDFSSQNKDGEYAQAHGNADAVNHDGLSPRHNIENIHTKSRTSDISLHITRNSKLLPCSGNGDTLMTDALDASNNELTVASNCKPERVVPDENVKADVKDFSGASGNVKYKTSYSKKVASRKAKNAFARGPPSDSMVVDGPVVNNGKTVVSESEPHKMITHEHVGATGKDGSDSAIVAGYRTTFSEKVPVAGTGDSISKTLRNVHTKRNDAQAASNLEFGKVVSEENTGTATDPKKFVSSASTEEHQRNSQKELPTTRVRSSVAKRSQISNSKMTGESSVDKTEAVAAKSLFDDLFPSENIDDYPKKLSSCASVDSGGSLSPNNALSTGVRNALGKRKIKAVEDKSDSKLSKIGAAIVSAAKAATSRRTEESSCKINKVTADQDSLKANGMRDISELFSKDISMVDRSEKLHNSKLKCSKRNKTLPSDHQKENRQDKCTLSPKTIDRTGSKNSKSDANSMQDSADILNENRRIKGNGPGTLITMEPAYFILSGNRQQRRDYRSILRPLKARVCRDSHHWSYEATHFIAPDPLKRTEKFFAAAAAGRWILKSDYLSSCNEAGKFLEEEPFEWFGTGLNDGETISLEAPKKWRALRQEMGHGAFYGMQIIVYGQLISPTLDTLKRAVRSGDGTILATSPPYTRFLNSGVDFAVVSASMPSADAWVQQFINHNIPCVSADYLVQYVCKPGYPLDRHVLFKTEDQAKKSLKKLLQNQQEVATDIMKPQEGDPDDLSCSVCGRTDRGEVMLICGDEDGSTGCGVGMHIDCCDPPLEAVPEDDWLCPKCEVPKTKKKPATRTASKSRASKRR
ncbi:hypothetical protein ABZP36_005874 [Zizania latifolia]